MEVIQYEIQQFKYRILVRRLKLCLTNIKFVMAGNLDKCSGSAVSGLHVRKI